MTLAGLKYARGRLRARSGAERTPDLMQQTSLTLFGGGFPGSGGMVFARLAACPWLLAVFGDAAGQQTKGMRKRWQNSTQAFAHALGAAGEVDDQGGAACAGNGARQHPKRGMFQAFQSHCFGDSWRLTFKHGQGSFGGQIIWTQAGPAGGQNKLEFTLVGPLAQPRFNRGLVVRDDFIGGNLAADVWGTDDFADGRAAGIFALTARAFGTDGEDANAKHGGSLSSQEGVIGHTIKRRVPRDNITPRAGWYATPQGCWLLRVGRRMADRL